jgi:hypothetical protein
LNLRQCGFVHRLQDMRQIDEVAHGQDFRALIALDG